jgi:sugar phosphate isomerase/epimerase
LTFYASRRVYEKEAKNGCTFAEGFHQDVNGGWPVVIKTLKDIGYQGWMTIEGSEKLSMEQRSRRLDLIIAGK